MRVLDRLAYLGVAQGDVATARRAAEECVSLTARGASMNEPVLLPVALAITVEQAGDLRPGRTSSYLEAVGAARGARAIPLLDRAAVSGLRGVLRCCRATTTRSEAAAAPRRSDLARELGDEMVGVDQRG